MEAARTRRSSKDAENIRVAQLMTKLVMKVAQESDEQGGSSKEFTGTQGIQVRGSVTREMFQRAVKDKEVVGLIEDLDIQIGDPSELFDAVDADGSGCVDL